MKLRSKRLIPTAEIFYKPRKRLQTVSTNCTSEDLSTILKSHKSSATIDNMQLHEENTKFDTKPSLPIQSNSHTINLSEIDQYTCSICQHLRSQKIFKLINCSHYFCRKCLQNYLNFLSISPKKGNLKPNCPICRQDFTEEDVKPEKLQKISVLCKCGLVLPRKQFNSHKSNCFGKIFQEVQKFEASKKHIPKVNRSTFSCSQCNTRNLDRVGLIEHYRKYHRGDSWGVCPICVMMPWGVSDFETHVYRHLKKRHMFDFDYLVDFDYTEDQM